MAIKIKGRERGKEESEKKIELDSQESPNFDLTAHALKTLKLDWQKIMSLVLSAPLKNGSKGLVQTAVFPPKNWLTARECAENTNRLRGILLWHLVVSGNLCTNYSRKPPIPMFSNFPEL